MGAKRIYHDVFVPLEDVYELGGPTAFEHLGRKEEQEGQSLIVVPESVWKGLSDLKKEGSLGAEHTLSFLKNKGSLRNVTREKGIALCPIHSGLDVAILKESKMGDEGVDAAMRGDISSLEHIIRQRWVPTDEDTVGRPEFITNNSTQHLEWGVLGDLRIKDPRFLQVSTDIVNEGIILGNEDLYVALHRNGGAQIPLKIAEELMDRDLYPNQFIQFIGASQRKEFAQIRGTLSHDRRGKVNGINNVVVELIHPREYSQRLLHVGDHERRDIFGIKPEDTEQYLAMQHGLLNPDVSVFFLTGSQGSGKTLLSYVCGVDMVLDYDKEIRTQRFGQGIDRKGAFYRQIVLLKPNEVLGGKRRDIGFLPGNLFEKMKPHLEPYIDAHDESDLGELFPFDEMLKHPRFGNDFFGPRDKRYAKVKVDGCASLSPRREAFKPGNSGFMRGRSFRETLVLVDETQNLTPYEVKTIIERLGPGSAIVLMGDPLQTDNPFCSPGINGLTHGIRHYLPTAFSGLVNLSRNYRSAASDHALSWKTFAGN